MTKGRWAAVVLATGIAAAVFLVVTLSGGTKGDARHPYAAFNPRFEAAQEGHEAKFDRGNGKEGRREGPSNPNAEQVENRAYPRSYVDDKDAKKSRAAFDSKPKRPTRAGFQTTAAYNTATATSPKAPWQLLGPVTPNVAGEASQFVEPDNGFTGPPTQESGRVTALAIDPNCGKGSAPSGAPCRLWVAAAGGGIWRTNDALASKPDWIAPPDDLPTNAFGSLIVDPNDPTGSTLYAGSGEPNGSGDSEAGLGLFKSTDGGRTWALVPGSQSVAINRSVGAIVVKPGDPQTIYIGTDVARHGSSAVNGGRRTPPDAPELGVYKSTDGGQTFTLEAELHAKTPQNPTPPSTGVDWFQGGVNKLELDPNDANTVYAAVVGYGLWRSNDGGTTWTQVFHTMNQTDFGAGTGDFFGDRTEFDAVDLGTETRIYLGDSSDDLGRAQVYRTDDAAAIVGDPSGNYSNAGWRKLSDKTNGTPQFLPYYYCQNGQCGYDNFVVSPASQLGVGSGQENTLWLGGSMNYDELPYYNTAPPRSNGRGVIRSTNAGELPSNINWYDMSATLGDSPGYHFTKGIHPDQHAVVFVPKQPDLAFVGSDGGVVLIDVRHPDDKSAACNQRRYKYDGQTPTPLKPNDLLDCRRLLSGIPQTITPINDGLVTMQFQSLSFNPQNPTGELLGGTQDNGTWAFTGSPTWLESVGGDGGQSGFDAGDPTIRYHNYYDATPEVNRKGNNPRTWRAIYDPLQSSPEARSFYVPFIADPVVPGRAFTGLEHVWRTDDNGGDPKYLAAHCDAVTLPDPNRTKPCGDWQPIGENLANGAKFGGDRKGHYVVADERAPSDRGTLWAGTRIGRLFVTKNADAAPGDVTFWRIDTPATPGRFVSGIAIDPRDPNHAWISYSGYGRYTPDTPQHVLEAQYDPASHTATFTDRTYDLGDQPVTGIAENDATQDVYVATDFGVLRLPHTGNQWHVAGTGLPQVAVYGLTISQSAHVLYAATHGRGAWRLDLPT
jgi:hypothetical protein